MAERQGAGSKRNEVTADRGDLKNFFAVQTPTGEVYFTDL
jgi:hypothetical protein